MNAESVRDFCLEQPHVTEDLPFGPETVVFRIGGKIFLLLSLDTEALSFNVKCDPERAEELRERHPGVVRPGFHMNKKHWNTVEPKEGTSDSILKEWILHSYDLVRNSLPKKSRELLP
ncbi:MmcQ/YjbR family DNA-binding protein [Ravibacter arvi]|uniref:MmcQ/YjbR family DNA-binding protein n=1 Tax=Ravibacter arvi TaxID=2051041 RepID=A0ABP8LS26_9BACT